MYKGVPGLEYSGPGQDSRLALAQLSVQNRVVKTNCLVYNTVSMKFHGQMKCIYKMSAYECQWLSIKCVNERSVFDMYNLKMRLFWTVRTDKHNEQIILFHKKWAFFSRKCQINSSSKCFSFYSSHTEFQQRISLNCNLPHRTLRRTFKIANKALIINGDPISYVQFVHPIGHNIWDTK